MIFLVIALILLAAAAGIYYSKSQSLPKVNSSAINSFDDCVKAGYPVLTTYPEQCKTPDGRNFVKPTPIQSFPPNPQPTGVISNPDQIPPQIPR